MNQITLVIGASSGFGRMIANALADAGHTAYASMRSLSGKNAHQVEEIGAYARDHGVDLRSVELDVQSEESAAAAVGKIIAEHGRLDVLIHNAGFLAGGLPGERSISRARHELRRRRSADHGRRNCLGWSA